MTDGLNPVTQQRRLRTELRHARADAGMSQQQVADALDWSLSKVIRIEHGAVRVSVTDLRAMLVLFGITEPERTDELVAIARLGKQRQWWDSYRKIIEPPLVQYLELESAAIRVRQYVSNITPGLLQTRDYARSVMSLHNHDESAEVIEQFTSLRLKRQEILADEGREFFFVLDEAVLRRRIGTPETMREQRAQLVELNRRPNVSIQVLPFSAGSHRAMYRSFNVVEVPTGIGDDLEVTVVLQGALVDTLIKNDLDKASEFVEMFMTLESMATPAAELATLIEGLTSSGE